MKIDLPRPTGDEALVECLIKGTFSSNSYRLYHWKKLNPPAKPYHSRRSGGQVHWTVLDEGPEGEEVGPARYFVVTEGEGYIGHFFGWEDFCEFLWQMGAYKITVI